MMKRLLMTRVPKFTRSISIVAFPHSIVSRSPSPLNPSQLKSACENFSLDPQMLDKSIVAVHTDASENRSDVVGGGLGWVARSPGGVVLDYNYRWVRGNFNTGKLEIMALNDYLSNPLSQYKKQIISMDSDPAVRCIIKALKGQTGKSDDEITLAQEALRLMKQNFMPDTEIYVSYVPKKANSLADSLSNVARLLHTDYKFSPMAIKSVEAIKSARDVFEEGMRSGDIGVYSD